MASNSKSDANANVEAYKTLIQGIQENMPAKTTIVLCNQTFTPASLCARLQARVDKNAATVAARTDYRSRVKEEADAVEDVRPLRIAFRGLITGQLGASNEDLTKYGFQPAKPRKVAAAVKAKAAAQAVATRKARNPYTKEEKKKIKGTVAEAETAGGVAEPGASTVAPQAAPAPAANGANPAMGH